jgi:hypothetical protein
MGGDVRLGQLGHLRVVVMVMTVIVTMTMMMMIMGMMITVRGIVVRAGVVVILGDFFLG